MKLTNVKFINKSSQRKLQKCHKVDKSCKMYKFLNLTIVLILTSAHTLTRKTPPKEQTPPPKKPTNNLTPPPRKTPNQQSNKIEMFFFLKTISPPLSYTKTKKAHTQKHKTDTKKPNNNTKRNNK